MTMPKQKPGKSGQVFSTPANFMRAITRRPDIREFTIDLAADPLNAKAHRWLGPGGEHPDALSFRSWAPLILRDPVPQRWGWLNPPFAKIGPWAERCAATRDEGGRVAFLVPAAVGSNWFRDHVDGKALVLFLNGRLHFMPDKPTWGYPKDCILALYGVRPGYEVWSWNGK
jgi:phage N-6-adenine-methyltransferase